MIRYFTIDKSESLQNEMHSVGIETVSVSSEMEAWQHIIGHGLRGGIILKSDIRFCAKPLESDAVYLAEDTILDILFLESGIARRDDCKAGKIEGRHNGRSIFQTNKLDMHSSYYITQDFASRLLKEKRTGLHEDMDASNAWVTLTPIVHKVMPIEKKSVKSKDNVMLTNKAECMDMIAEIISAIESGNSVTVAWWTGNQK